jgi:hypothetical protein
MEEPALYSVDTFLKYRDLNRVPDPKFERYFLADVKSQKETFKYKKMDSLDRPDVRTKLNYILSRRNVSNEDDQIYKLIMKVLNKVNNNILDPAKNETLNAAIQTLTAIKYSKIEHFQKLAELIVDKSLNEPTFCSVYAVLSTSMACYYIEVIAGPDKQKKKVYFRHILLNICQTTFETFLNNCENVERVKLIGLMKFLGELYVRGLLPSVIIKGCFDRLSALINDVHNVGDAIAELVIVTYNFLRDEKNDSAMYVKAKLLSFIAENKMNLKSKFALQNAVEFINAQH